MFNNRAQGQGWQEATPKRLSEDFGVPAFLNNDCNAAALGEWMFGAARGHHDVLYITVSTGIGAGVISEDRLIRGFHGIATELGHVIMDLRWASVQLRLPRPCGIVLFRSCDRSLCARGNRQGHGLCVEAKP